MASLSIKLLDKVIHEGHFVEAGETIQLDAEHAQKLIDDGVAEAEGAVKRVARKVASKGDGDSSDGE